MKTLAPSRAYGHADLKPMIAKSFANHKMKRGPGYTWRPAKGGTGAYSFRVTWAPGILVVSGDIGDETYSVWPSFATLWGAVELVHDAGWDYLTGKSTATEKFDLEATVEHLVSSAYQHLRKWRHLDDCGRRIVEHYCVDPENAEDRKSAFRQLRDDASLTAEKIYDMTSDGEAPSYNYHAETRWTYEALSLWARTMLAQEPLWHRAWRRAQREWAHLKGLRRNPPIFRPQLFDAQKQFNGSRYWIRHEYPDGGACMRSVYPFRLFGRDLSRLGFWRESGSQWPLRDDSHHNIEFIPVR